MQTPQMHPLNKPVPLRLLLAAMFEATSNRRDRERTELEMRNAEAVRRFVTDFSGKYGVSQEMVDDAANDWWESQAD